MSTDTGKERLAAALRAKYVGPVAEAFVYLAIVFEKGLEKSKQLILMVQLLSERGIIQIPEDAPEPTPFETISDGEIEEIDRVRFKRVTAFVKDTVGDSGKPVDVVAEAVLRFLEDQPGEKERAVVCGRMFVEGLTPYVQIPEGMITDRDASDATVTRAVQDPEVIRAVHQIDSIFRREGISNGQRLLAMGKVFARFGDRPDMLAALVSFTSAFLQRAQPRTSIEVMMVRGGGNRPAPSFGALIDLLSGSCDNPNCLIHGQKRG